MGKLFARAFKLGGSLILIATVGFCGLVNFANIPSKGDRDREARASAEELVEILRTYHAEYGRYPHTLSELPAGDAPSLPVPREGQSFDYIPDSEGQDFELGYYEAPIGALPSDGFHSFDASSGQWKFAFR